MYKKLSHYAKEKSVTYRTAYNHFKKGLITGAFLDDSNHVLIPLNQKSDEIYVTYSRVSSNEMKDNLVRQEERLLAYVNNNNLKLHKQVKEVASGMNDKRKGLCTLLADKTWNCLLVENKDRLTRFGFNYLELLLNQQGKKIVVVNNITDDKESLMQDLISIIYSFSARMYSLRKKRPKKEIIEFIECN
jgi:predicted site-specific integrase-resolvase